MSDKNLQKACMLCGSTDKPLRLVTCEHEGKLKALLYSCCPLPEESTLIYAPKMFSLSKKELAIKLETARLVLSAVAEKANVSSEQLLEILKDTEIRVRALED